MRLHTDVLTFSDIENATRASGMTGVHAHVTEHGSRARKRAFNVYLTGNSPRRPNSSSGNYAYDDHAATWDEWGMFFAALYEIDPNMIAGQSGRPTYDGAYSFYAATDGRFEWLTADDQHKTHKWLPTGALKLRYCKCGAKVNWSYMWNKREK